MGDVHRGETTNVMYAGRIAGDHVKTVHEGIFISYGLAFVPLESCSALRPKLVWLAKFNCVETVPRGNGHISGTIGTTSSGFFVDGARIQI